jgi:DNA mismatch endonuclease (patch repair protein)
MKPSRARSNSSPSKLLPYPHPTTAAVTAVMKGNRRADTRPEVALRSDLHRRGLRFRKDVALRPAERLRRVDIVFPSVKLAVFVDGCFWHGCPEHGNRPKANTDYWTPKLSRNVARDAEINRELTSAGWSVIRVWEHEDNASAGERIAREHRRLRGRRTP